MPRKYRGRKSGKSGDNRWVYGSLFVSKHPFLPDIEEFFIIPRTSVPEEETGDNDDEVYYILPNLHSVDPSSVGHHIGRQDKNGVEIFEGDRVKYRTRAGQPGEGIVEFLKDHYVIRYKMRSAKSWNLIFEVGGSAKIEVIGNIVEEAEAEAAATTKERQNDTL